jgi:L-ectoine synthase
MIVRTLKDIIDTERDVSDPKGNWISRRLLLRGDGMGFSFHETVIFKGTETKIWYKNHLEAVYCVEGEGELETIPQKEIYPINPGTIYALDKNDQHYLRATHSDLRLVCVFSPPLSGGEVHDEDGSYPPSGHLIK